MSWLLIIVGLWCLLAVVHTYLLYPMVTINKAHSTAKIKPVNAVAEWPEVYVLMAVHNEEIVLADKLGSLAEQNYPGRLTILIGSDNSTDGTEAILSSFDLLSPLRSYRWSANASRLGKPGTINRLAQQAGPEGVYVMTDASVILAPDAITELVRPIVANPEIGLVDARLVHTGLRSTGISRSEDTYINREVRLKEAEGRLYGHIIGPFGGCWALRAEAFHPVPTNFLVDDFFLCMKAYQAGWRGISRAEARVYEGVGQRLEDEFRRKLRIGSGNWQNLIYFRNLWWPPTKNALAFAFFSHKVLRWLTPFFLILIALCLIGLSWLPGNYWAEVLLALTLGGAAGNALLDVVLSRLNIHLRPSRHLNYFLAMNAALLLGFFRYLTGIKSNVWKPSHRN